MKKRFAATILMAIAILLSSASFARQAMDSTYPLILSFYSIGTGTPGIEPLQQFISAYRKKNRLRALQAIKVGGLGREGEYAIFFPLKELNKTQQKNFVSALSKALPTLKQKTERGGINLAQNEPFDTSRGRIQPQSITF